MSTRLYIYFKNEPSNRSLQCVPEKDVTKNREQMDWNTVKRIDEINKAAR